MDEPGTPRAVSSPWSLTLMGLWGSNQKLTARRRNSGDVSYKSSLIGPQINIMCKHVRVKRLAVLTAAWAKEPKAPLCALIMLLAGAAAGPLEASYE